MKLLISEYSSGFADSTSPLCNALAEYDDFDITYISDKDNSYMDNIVDTVRKEKIFDVFANDVNYKKWTFKWAINRFSTALKNCRRRNRYVQENKPDITLIELTMASIDCHYIRKIKPYTKIVYTVHDVLVPTKSLSWSKNSLKRMYDAADFMVVHTCANKKQLINDFDVSEHKVKIIPHGVEVLYNKIEKNECRKKLGIGYGEKVLLFYGGIRKSKGLDILLDAMKGINALLIIAGAMPYGESFEPYKKKIEENQIRTIQYIKFTEDNFRDVLFQAADYLVLPYREFSSQSGVLMQALRYHLPVIATDVGTFKEYVEKYQIGFCCKANNVESLNESIRNALLSDKNFLKNLKLAAEAHSWNNSAKKYRELFLNMENG